MRSRPSMYKKADGWSEPKPNPTEKDLLGEWANPKAGQENSKETSPLDRDLFIEAATIIRMAEIEAKVNVRPDKLGQLILDIYDEYAAGRQVESAKVIRLVQAWAA